MKNISYTILALFAISITTSVSAGSICSDLLETNHNDQAVLSALKGSSNDIMNDFECIGALVKSNFFESAEYMIQAQFSKGQASAKNLNQAQSIVQTAIEHVRVQQDNVMRTFDTTSTLSQYSDSIRIVAPSLRWTQSARNVFLEVKFSTRWDAPSCLDVSNHNITISDEKILSVSALCKSDTGLMKYTIDIALNSEVNPFVWDDEALNAQNEKVMSYQTDLKLWQAVNETYHKAMDKYEDDLHKYNEQQYKIEERAHKKKQAEIKKAEEAIAKQEGTEEVTEDKTEEKSAEDEIVDDDEEIPEDQLVKEPKLPDEIKRSPIYPEAPLVSYYEEMTAGRVYLNLTKTAQPSRWRRIYDKEMQPRVGNIQFWWELYEKYEQELKRVERWEEDDDENGGMGGFGFETDSDEVAKKEKAEKKKNKKKQKKAKKAKKDSGDEVKDDL